MELQVCYLFSFHEHAWSNMTINRNGHFQKVSYLIVDWLLIGFVQYPHLVVGFFNDFDPKVCDIIIKTIFWISKTNVLNLLKMTPLFYLCIKPSRLFWFLFCSVIWSAWCCSFYFLFLVVMVLLLSLCRITRSWHEVLWLIWLHCPLVDPSKARARTPLTSTLALWRRCRSAGLIPFPKNSWPIWLKEEGQTCALSAHTCSVFRGQDLPTTLQGQRPPCEHKQRLWNVVYVKLVS